MGARQRWPDLCSVPRHGTGNLRAGYWKLRGLVNSFRGRNQDGMGVGRVSEEREEKEGERARAEDKSRKNGK